jgi:lipopolysaccharide/colanic/teichoic acid biosynthesis glycosyltransferase
MGVMILIVLSLFFRDLFMISRGWLVLCWGLSSVLVVLERFIVRHIAYILRRHGYLTARVLIVGVSEQGIAIARQWSQSLTSGMQMVGFVDDFKPLGTPVVNGLKVIGRPTALHELGHRTGANEVVVVPNAVAWETFEEMIARASTPNGYTLRLSPGFYELLTTGVAVTNKAFVPLLTINEARIVGTDAVLKLLLDYGLGVPLLILAAPLMGLIALGLQLVRPHGPVLAHYQTFGQCGTTFEMLKFFIRMEPVAQAANQNRMKETTWVSLSWLERALYRSGLDKLPQLFNVMAGQMSLVGPRPRVVDEKADSGTVRNLQTVKPGFIGPWTSSGPCDPKDETQDELYYVRNWTIWVDLQALVQTLLYVFSSCWRARRIAANRQFGRPVFTSVSSSARHPSQLALSKLSKNDSDERYSRG